MVDDMDRRRNICYLLGVIALIVAIVALAGMAHTSLAALTTSLW